MKQPWTNPIDPNVIADLLKSNESTPVAAAYYRSLGHKTRWTPLTLEIIGEMGDQYDPDNDIGDLFISGNGLPTEMHVEVKRRLRADMDFHGPDTYPFDTVMVDNVHKVDRGAPSYHYFILNRTMSCAAIVHGTTRPTWTIRSFFNRGRVRRTYEVPKDLVAEWVKLGA